MDARLCTFFCALQTNTTAILHPFTMPIFSYTFSQKYLHNETSGVARVALLAGWMPCLMDNHQSMEDASTNRMKLPKHTDLLF